MLPLLIALRVALDCSHPQSRQHLGTFTSPRLSSHVKEKLLLPRLNLAKDTEFSVNGDCEVLLGWELSSLLPQCPGLSLSRQPADWAESSEPACWGPRDVLEV